MKHILLLLFALILTCTTAQAGSSYDPNCVIEKFEYFAQVHADNTWDVTEYIHANFDQPRHGLFQYVEQKYDVTIDGQTQSFFAPVTDIEINHPFKITYRENDRYTVVRMGDSDKYVQGEVVYAIKYKLHFPDDGYEKFDVLFTSVLGAMCEHDILELEYNITFDEPLPAAFADSLRVYSGPAGRVDNPLQVPCNVIGQNLINGTVTNISHHNGITLYAKLPAGYWKSPASPMDLRLTWVVEWFKSSFVNLTTLLVLCLCILFVYLLIKLLLNRGGNKPFSVIEYGAPEGISSAEVGYIIDMSVDVNDLTSLIIWWASKGYLDIEEAESKKGKKKKDDEPEIVLHKLKDLPADAPEYQQKFWKVFFSGKDSVAISKIGKRYKQIQSAQKALEDKYTGQYALQTINYRLARYFFAFLILSVITILVSCWSQNGFYLLFVWGAAVVYGALRNIYRSEAKYVKSWWKKLLDYAIMAALFCVSIFMVFLVIDSGSPTCPNLVLYGVTVMTWILILLSHKMQQDTPYRIELMSRLLGFRQFINSAEMPMLKALVDENPNYFYDVLPYAIVFGLSDKWCKQFKEIDFDPPTWYNAGTALAAAEIVVAGAAVASMLTDRFDKVISTHVQSSSVSPSSDSSSGSSSHSGGYSGGGGGGGGIGSW